MGQKLLVMWIDFKRMNSPDGAELYHPGSFNESIITSPAAYTATEV